MGDKSLLWVNHFAVTPLQGGGTRHFELSRELRRRGWHVTVAACDYHYQSRKYIRRAGPEQRTAIVEPVDGVTFEWLWGAPYERNNWRRAWNWISFCQSLLSAELSRPSVVIGSSPHLFAAAAAARLASRWEVPFVLEVRDLWPESLLAAGGRKGIAYSALDRLASWLYRRADRIICLAEGTRRELAARGIPAEKLDYVPNGVDPAQFGDPRKSGADQFTLVYAGAHGPANGLEVVLGAAELLRDDAGVKFMLVGDGPSKNSLVNSAKDRGLSNVEFRDPVSKHEIADLFARCDAGLMVLRESPLFSFGVSPNKLFDYLAARLPVICNVPGEVAAMLRAAEAGIQAENASAVALAASVRHLRTLTATQRSDMGERGRSWVAREHGRPVLADRLDEALQKLLKA